MIALTVYCILSQLRCGFTEFIGSQSVVIGSIIAFSAGDRLALVWSNPHEDHKGYVDLEWLKENCYSDTSLQERRQKSTPRVTVSSWILGVKSYTVLC